LQACLTISVECQAETPCHSWHGVFVLPATEGNAVGIDVLLSRRSQGQGVTAVGESFAWPLRTDCAFEPAYLKRLETVTAQPRLGNATGRQADSDDFSVVLNMHAIKAAESGVRGKHLFSIFFGDRNCYAVGL